MKKKYWCENLKIQRIFVSAKPTRYFLRFQVFLKKAKVALDDTGTITKYVMYFSSFLQAWRGSLLTVWSLWKFCITWKLFREINFIVKVFTKEVVFTEIFQKIVIQKFRKLHSIFTVLESRHYYRIDFT